MPKIVLNQAAHDILSPFQIEDAAFVAKNRTAVLGHPTGMGKSLISLLAASQMPRVNRILVLGGKSAASTWNIQPMKWADTQTQFIAGAPHERRPIWDDAKRKGGEGIWFMTYAMFVIMMKQEAPTAQPHWDCVIADEAHKLRLRTTQLYAQMRRIRFDNFIPMSATWASRGPQDCWAILHLINRKRFSSYWRFVEQYCYVEDNGYGKEIFGVRNATALRDIMKNHYYRSRRWEEIGYQMPPIRREVVKLPMTKEQTKVYGELDREMMVEYAGTFVITQNDLSKLTRLHQLAVVPQVLVPGMGVGAGLEYILEALEDDPHTVIYTYFAEAIPMIEAALIGAGYDRVFSLKGGTPMEEVDRRVLAWKKQKGIMLCSVKFAESFRIDTTHTAYMLGFSFDPNENIQAEGRLRALDSEIKSPVLVKYLIIERSIVEHVQEVVNDKVRTLSQIFTSYQQSRAARP